MISRKLKCSVLALLAMGYLNPMAYAETTEKLDTYDIGETVVTATGYDQDKKDAPASITVISKEEIAKNGFTDLRDVLSKVEGVDVYGSPGRMGTANVSIRGMGSKYTLLMIDGVPLNNSTDQNVGPNGFNMELSSLLPPANNIERIEVIKGPMSTLYGSDALGGVINIITKKVTDKVTGTLSVDHTFEKGNRGDTTRASLNVSGPVVKDKLGLQLRGNHILRLNSYDKDGNTQDGANVTPSGAKNYGVGAKLSWTPNKNSAYTLDASNTVADYSDHGYSNLGVKFSRQRYVLSAENKVKDGSFYTDLSYQKTKLHDWGHFNGTADKYKTMENENLIFNEKYVTNAIDKHKITVGTKLWREAVDLDTLRVQGIKGDLSAFNKALFAEDTWQMGKKIAFTYGLRYDMPEYFDSHISPRGYLVYKADNDWTIKGGVTSGYSAPSLVSTQPGIVSISDSRQGRGGGRRSYTYGNPNLKPETSINKEIGVYYGQPGKLRAHLTYFDIDYKDKIGTVEIGSNRNQYTNTTEASSHGIEFGTSIPLHKKWDLDMNGTITSSKIIGGKYDGQPIDHTPKYMFNSRLTYYADNKTSMWLGMEYRDKMARYAGGSKETAAVVASMGEYYKPFTIFNFGLQHKVNDAVQLNFAINNLFNKDFDETKVVNGTEYNYYCSTGRGGTGSYIGGRSYWVGVTYNF